MSFSLMVTLSDTVRKTRSERFSRQNPAALVESIESAKFLVASDKTDIELADLAATMSILQDCFSHCAELSRDEAQRKSLEDELRSLFAATKQLLSALLNRMVQKEVSVNNIFCDVDDDAVSSLIFKSFKVAFELSDLDFASFGMGTRLGIRLCQLAKEANSCLTLNDDGKTFNKMTKEPHIALQCLAPVSNALQVVDGEGSRPSAGEVQKLVFLLQVLDKMAELFGIGTDFKDLIDLLSTLVQIRDFSTTRDAEMGEALKQKLTIHVPGWTESIIDRLIAENGFARAALKSEGPSDFGHFLLTCTILSRLVKVEDKQVKDVNWFPQKGRDLFSLCLERSRGCGGSFTRDPFLVGVSCAPGNPADKPVSAYEFAITLVQSFIVHADRDDFTAIERGLFSEILDNSAVGSGADYWSKKLASDVWCFLARYAVASVCGSHVKLLTDAHLSTASCNIYLRALIFRLSSCISVASRDVFMTAYDPRSNPDKLAAWAALDSTLCNESFKSCLRDFSAVNLKKFEDGRLTKLSLVTASMRVLVRLFDGDNDGARVGISASVAAIWAKLSAGGYEPSAKNEPAASFLESLCKLTRKCLESRSMSAKSFADIVGDLESIAARSGRPDYVSYLQADILRAHETLLPENDAVVSALSTVLSCDRLSPAVELKLFDTFKTYAEDGRFRYGTYVTVSEKVECVAERDSPLANHLFDAQEFFASTDEDDDGDLNLGDGGENQLLSVVLSALAQVESLVRDKKVQGQLSDARRVVETLNELKNGLA